MKRSGPIARSSALRRGGRVKPVNRARRAKAYAEDFGDHAVTIRAMPCALCTVEDRSVPAHLTSRAAGGTAKDLAPLCTPCHDAFDGRAGIKRYEEARRHEARLRTLAAKLWAAHLAGLAAPDLTTETTDQ